MNLKKIGSALTAISMIASMATYVPFSASAAETPDTVYTGTLDYYPDVAYSLNVTKDILTLSPSVAGATYEIPATVLEEVAYEFVGETTEATYGTAAQVAAEAVTINIEGKAVIDVDESGDITGTSETTSVKADCRAVIKTADSTPVISAVTNEKLAGISASTASVEVEVTHDYQPNRTYHNHVCENCGLVNNDEHDFNGDTATIDPENHTHECACGKLDTDYLTVDEDGKITDPTGKYAEIHGYSASNHYCLDCGGYSKVIHQGDEQLAYTRTSTTHSVTCKKDGDEDCDFALPAENHDMVAYWAETGNAAKDVSGINVYPGEHYCRVCGYVPRDTEESVSDNTHYNGGHEYNYKYESYFDESGAAHKRLVAATVASEKVVCACGAVKPTHGKTGDIHNYNIVANGKHMCICGQTISTHSFQYNYTGNGAYTVNGQTGFDDVGDGNGVICACGELVDGHSDTCKATAHSISGDATEIYVDTNAHKHYCICGKLIKNEDGNEVHTFVTDADNNVHKCNCGLTSEAEHNFNVSYYKVLYNPTAEKYELVEMKSGKDLSGYQLSAADDTAPTFDATKAIICECGKVDSARHSTCTFNMHVGNVHYCSCGKSSNEHTYDATTKKCTVCGKYVDHECKPNDNCKCTVCGEDAHTLVKYLTNSHICAKCGAIVEAHDYQADPSTKTHVCSICGAAATDPTVHNWGTEGTDKCKCNDCGYVKHTIVYGDNTATTEVKRVHYCSKCGTDFPNEHTYDQANNTKCECGNYDPNHDCAFDHNRAASCATDHAYEVAGLTTGDEVCKCGRKVAHEYALKDADDHYCVHKNGSTACSSTGVAHTYDAATGTFCTACGAVNFGDKTPGVPTAAKKVVQAYREFSGDMTSKYQVSYIVDVTTAYNDVIAYSYAKMLEKYNNNTANAMANTLVAKTPEEQEVFNNYVAAFNALLTDENKTANQAGCTATINFATGSDAMVEDLATTLGAGAYISGSTAVLRGQKGSTVTLKVVPKQGYKFVGWYDANPASETAQLLSTSSEYPVQLTIEGNKDYYAKLDKNDKVDIEIAYGIKYDGEITGAGTGKDAGVDFILNEEVEVSYVIPAANAANEEFLYFYDEYDNIYKADVADNTPNADDKTYSYTFKVSGSISKIYAKTAKVTGNDVFVTFQGSDDDKSRAERTRVVEKDVNNNINLYGLEPTLAGRVGVEFVGWAKKDANPKTIERIKQINVGTAKTLTLVPVYKNQSGFKLTIDGGSFVNVSDDKLAEGFTYNENVGITAPEKDAKTGKYFSGWYVNDVFYSMTRTTYYTVQGNASIVAKFDNDEPAEDISYLTISSTTSTDTGVRVVNLAAKWSLLTKDYSEVLDSGYVFSFTGKTAADLTLENVDNSTVRKKVVGETAMTGSTNYPLTLKSDATKNATVTAVAYLTVRDANGNVKTIYSDNMVTAMP